MLFAINQFISIFIRNSISRWLFAIVFGLLLNIAMPQIGFWFYAWFGLIPLLILIKTSSRYLTACFEGFLFLISFNLGSFIWLLGLHPLTWQGLSNEESLVAALLAWILPSLFHSLILIPFIIFAKFIFKERQEDRIQELKFSDIVLIAFIWVAIEHKLLLNLGPELGLFVVPINLLAYSQYLNVLIIQICDTVGAVGLEFLLVVFNLFISNFFNVHKLDSQVNFGSSLNVKNPFFGILNPQGQFAIGTILSFSLIISIFYSAIKINQYRVFEIKNPDLAWDYALVQADLKAPETRSQNTDPQKLVQLQEELSSKIKDKKNLLLWAEGSVPVLDRSNFESFLYNKLKSKSQIFVYGTFHQDKEDSYNALAIVNLYENNKVSFYDKQTLVPFGEYTPFYNFFPDSLKQLANSTVGSGFSFGKKAPEVINALGLKFASSICFELLFPVPIREQISKGSNVIINLSDLSWFNSFTNVINIGFLKTWGKDIVKKQFLAAGIFRAVENNRYLILAGNAGYSAAISATGQIKDLTQTSSIEVLQGKFIPFSSKSLYTLYGW